MLSEIDQKLLQVAYDEAKAGFLEGGCPWLSNRNGEILARVEIKSERRSYILGNGCIRKAGRQKTYKDTVLYTSLSPCMMCGTIVQFGIPKVVIGENKTFGEMKSF